MILLACSHCGTLFLDTLRREGTICPHAIKHERTRAGITLTTAVRCPGTLKPAIRIPTGAQYL